LAGEPPSSTNPGQAATPTKRLETAWLTGRFRHTAPWPPVQIRPIWFAWPACRH
jgi:hypothetical protein